MCLCRSACQPNPLASPLLLSGTDRRDAHCKVHRGDLLAIRGAAEAQTTETAVCSPRQRAALNKKLGVENGAGSGKRVYFCLYGGKEGGKKKT